MRWNNRWSNRRNNRRNRWKGSLTLALAGGGVDRDSEVVSVILHPATAEHCLRVKLSHDLLFLLGCVGEGRGRRRKGGGEGRRRKEERGKREDGRVKGGRRGKGKGKGGLPHIFRLLYILG